MKNAWLAVVLLGYWASALSAPAAGRPLISFGPSWESSTENKIDQHAVRFANYGARLGLVSNGCFEVFAGLGLEQLSFPTVTADAAFSYGVAGTLWLKKIEYYSVPDYFGLYGSYHASSVDAQYKGGGDRFSIQHRRYVGQVALKSASGPLRPFVRAGVMGSELETGEGHALGLSKSNATRAAFNGGAEWEWWPGWVVTLELGYAEALGGAARLEYRF